MALRIYKIINGKNFGNVFEYSSENIDGKRDRNVGGGCLVHNIAGNCTVSSNFVPSVSGMPQFPPPSFVPMIVMMISMIMMFLVKRPSSIFIKTDQGVCGDAKGAEDNPETRILVSVC